MSDRGKVLRFVSKKERRFLAAPSEQTPWTPLGRDMMESPAWRALTLAGRKVIDRLCIENCNHAGHENGRLAVSFDEFAAFGIDRRSVKRALDEATALGFICCTKAGQRAYGIFQGRAATYRLTFVGMVGDGAAPATHEWKAVTLERASETTAALRSAGRHAKRKRPPPARI